MWKPRREEDDAAMIQLPIRRCSECGYIGPVGRFKDAERSQLTCPRCGHEMADTFDPRLT
ncbi:hypothetical protein [Halomicrococcus sp. NG-SE-24]|uniref:hypothetical protein n=1 Tax=unclassified Halomicrococcus TaxID=2614448 RepID=UPI0011BF4145